MYIIILISFLFYINTYFNILLIIFSSKWVGWDSTSYINIFFISPNVNLMYGK